jgi:hypothetical protein
MPSDPHATPRVKPKLHQHERTLRRVSFRSARKRAGLRANTDVRRGPGGQTKGGGHRDVAAMPEAELPGLRLAMLAARTARPSSGPKPGVDLAGDAVGPLLRDVGG